MRGIKRTLFCKLSLIDILEMCVQSMSMSPKYPEEDSLINPLASICLKCVCNSCQGLQNILKEIRRLIHLHPICIDWWGESNLKFNLHTLWNLCTIIILFFSSSFCLCICSRPSTQNLTITIRFVSDFFLS
jgi:hypothetical protein